MPRKAKKEEKPTKKEKEACECMCQPKKCRPSCCDSGGCLYFLAAIGAAVYYLQAATGFWSGVWGLVKALLWPAFLVYKLFLM